MSETNFTEQDRETLREATYRNFGVNAGIRAIAEIDSLRRENRALRDKLGKVDGLSAESTCGECTKLVESK